MCSKPKVLIPIFPGTNGEYELERLFHKAGADVTKIVFNTLSNSNIEDSYKELTEAVNRTHILAISSGMSAGAEPDGSAKLITIVLRHSGIKDALNNLITKRKGLVLGFGEGFKALLKTGLIQTGEIQEKEQEDVLLLKHSTNKYHCTLRAVKYNNTNSPWLTGMNNTEETVPVSGLDGIIYMNDDLYEKYIENKQVASEFIDSSVYNNPLSKSHIVESLVSKNGLVYGRMGLVDKVEKGLYINVANVDDCWIFKNAVEYVRKCIIHNA
ncbi:MAG: phosphoribosylformylglycinamidine synthase subunit PurQ [Oscillospiraceae bacterium]|jgi:phosphoribosylformylglycinamidine synthase|nr:phosphoribosylformylglycinamidine synthase subunit PurQ [Oscillospiraceae bacterium]